MKSLYKNETGFSIVEGLIVILVLIAIGITAWLGHSRLQTPHTTAATSEQTMYDITVAVSKKFDVAGVTDATIATPTKQGRATYSASGNSQSYMTWKMPGDNFYVDLKARSITFGYYASAPNIGRSPLNVPDAQTLYDTIDAQLHADGFTTAPVTTSVDDTNNNTESPSAIYAYQNNKTYCTVLFSGNTHQYVTITCDSASDTASQTNTIKPFAESYLEATPMLSNKILFNLSDNGIAYGTSKTPDYSLASIQIKNPYGAIIAGIPATTEATAYFYKQAGGTWQYVPLNYGLGKRLNNVIVCEQFPTNNHDAYLAYVGQACTYDDASQSAGTI
jgi:hypothetical protein